METTLLNAKVVERKGGGKRDRRTGVVNAVVPGASGGVVLGVTWDAPPGENHQMSSVPLGDVELAAPPATP